MITKYWSRTLGNKIDENTGKKLSFFKRLFEKKVTISARDWYSTLADLILDITKIDNLCTLYQVRCSPDVTCILQANIAYRFERVDSYRPDKDCYNDGTIWGERVKVISDKTIPRNYIFIEDAGMCVAQIIIIEKL